MHFFVVMQAFYAFFEMVDPEGAGVLYVVRKMTRYSVVRDIFSAKSYVQYTTDNFKERIMLSKECASSF